MRECAGDIGMADTSISIIRNSDIFKDYRHRRLAEHHENISDSVIEKAQGVACTALDVLNERIRLQHESISLGIVKDTAEMALRALGFGASRSPGAGMNGSAPGVTIVVGATAEMLESAREKMKNITFHVDGTEDVGVGVETATEEEQIDPDVAAINAALMPLPAPS